MKNSKKRLKVLFKQHWPLVGIILAVFIFFWKFFIKDLIPLPADIIVGAYFPWLDYKWGFDVGVPVFNPIVSDAISFTYPMRILGINLIKSGISPLWNKYLLSGTPLLANFQSAPFSPTNFVYFIFDNLSAWGFQVVIQHFLAAIFTYSLLRYWKVSKIGSFVGSIAFAFSGFNLIWSQWNAHTLTASFFPLLILFSDRWLKKEKWIDGVGVSVVLALQFISGYPQLVIYSLISIGVLMVIRFSRKALKASLLLVIFILLGFGIAGVQLLPSYELLKLSQRSKEIIPMKWAFLEWREIITFFAPDYFGNHATGNYWGSKNYLSSTGFVGVVAFVLSSFSLIYLWKKREVKFLFFLLLTSLFLSFPTFVGIFLWKSKIVGLQAGISFRSLVLFSLSISLLSGFGVDFILKNKFDFKKAIILPFLTLGCFGIFTILNLGDENYLVALKNLILPTGLFFALVICLYIISKKMRLKFVGIACIIFLLIFELFRFGWKFTPFSSRHLVYPKTPTIEFLENSKEPFRVTGKGVMPVNQGMPYSLEFAGGYDAIYPERTAKFLGVLNSGTGESDPQDRYGTIDNINSRLIGLTNTKYVLVKKDYIYDNNIFTPVFTDKSVVILENKKVLPRAFMVYDWIVEKDTTKVFDILLDSKFPVSEMIIIEEDIDIEKFGTNLISNVEYKSVNDQKIVINVETKEDGLLFISDSYYPGWSAFVDGKNTKIFRANYAFRAIPVLKGEHIVVIEYNSISFDNGIRLSIVSIILLFIISMYRKRN